MAGKKLRVVVALFVLAFTLFSLVSASMVQASEVGSPQRQEAGGNLLVNPGFEGIGRSEDNSTPNPGNYTRATFSGAQYGEIYTPEGWVTWWQEGDYRSPECKVIPNEAPFNQEPQRIHRGYYSALCFTFYGKQNSGYYQVVRDIPPGSVVEGSFSAHAWSCGESDNAYSCGDPDGFYFRVGIDPNGGTDPFSQSIVWSAPAYHLDAYGRVGPVQATVGESGVATIFTQAYAKWAIKHNDAYKDSVSLRIVSPAVDPTETPPPPPPTPEEEVAPPEAQPTATARPDGAVVHTVVPGDTLFALALTYNVPVEQIYRLNNLDGSSLLQIGQEIVISTTDDVAPAPTAVPVEEPPTEAEPTEPEETDPEIGEQPQPSLPPATGAASVCVLAFHDANADMFRQDDEMLLPNAQVNLLAREGPVDSYTTDGISEPYCFRDLEPGTYVLRHTPPPGYELSDGGQWNLSLAAGATQTIELAYVRDTEAAPEQDTGEVNAIVADPTSDSDPDPGTAGVTNILNVVLRVSGFIVLALAIAVLVLFVLSRRTT